MSKPFTITRTFDAPRQLVWDAFTKAEHLQHWMGPAGTSMDHVKVDLRPGGVFHYGMTLPDGQTLWGKWTFREIDPPKKLVVIVAFSDEHLGVTRHPMAPVWPLETLSRTSFTEAGGKTTVTLEWSAYNATAEEQAVFDASHDSMTGGWSGTMEALGAYLKTQQSQKPAD